MKDTGTFGPTLGPQPGMDMTGHQNYINFLNSGNNQIAIHLPRKITQFDTTTEALENGLVPYSSPRGWSIGERNWTRGVGDQYTADLILDGVDVPGGVEAYVAHATDWSDDSVNRHFNISAQFYRKTD